MSKRECVLCRHFVADVLINDNREIFHGVCKFTKERKRFQDGCYRWEDVRDEQKRFNQQTGGDRCH